MRAVLPPNLSHLNQSKVGLADTRLGLQRVARAFPRHVAVREPAQLVVHEWYEPIEGLGFPSSPRQQQLRRTRRLVRNAQILPPRQRRGRRFSANFGLFL